MSSFLFLLILIEFIFLATCVFAKKYVSALFSLVVFGLFLEYVFGYSIIEWTINNWYFFIFLYLPLYLIIGFVWSLYKWYLFVSWHNYQYNILLQKFLNRTGYDKNNLNEQQKQEWRISLSNSGYVYLDKMNYYMIDLLGGNIVVKYKPDALEYKDFIISWLLFWPMSIFNTYIMDLFNNIIDFIYNWIHYIYNNLVNFIWKD